MVGPGETKVSKYFDRMGSPTVTLIRAHGKSILVDPGCSLYQKEAREATRLKKELFRILGTENADYLFITHNHPDHMILARYFDGQKLSGDGELLRGIVAFPAPGHDRRQRALRFECAEGVVVVAGDAVINEEYLNAANPAHRVYLPNGYTDEEVAQSLKTMEEIRRQADTIIPGHGPPFDVSRGQT